MATIYRIAKDEISHFKQLRDEYNESKAVYQQARNGVIDTERSYTLALFQHEKYPESITSERVQEIRQIWMLQKELEEITHDDYLLKWNL